jgi:hypothetical protein
MGRLWLLVTILVLPLLVGCSTSQGDAPLPAAAVSPPDAKTPPPRSAASSDVKKSLPVTAAKPAAKPPQKAAARQPARRLWDDFDLPLVIELQVPEAPPEIRKPSPPIQAQPKLP